MCLFCLICMCNVFAGEGVRSRGGVCLYGAHPELRRGGREGDAQVLYTLFCDGIHSSSY